MEKIRLLRADEIEARVNTISEKGLSLLLYKDARCDMNILDETFGIFGWQRHHTRDNANCIISIWDDDKKQWIDKEDTGTESFTEKEKGLASDSFKRAGFNVGIGRELYTAPFIWIPSSKTEIKKGNNGKLTTFDKFIVVEITYTDKRVIDGLKIVNQNGEVVFEKYPKQKKKEKKKEEAVICTDCGTPVESAMAARTKKAFGVVLCKDCGINRSKSQETPEKDYRQLLNDFCKENNLDIKDVAKKYHLDKNSTPEDFQKVGVQLILDLKAEEERIEREKQN